jgi:hypothetical protein
MDSTVQPDKIGPGPVPFKRSCFGHLTLYIKKCKFDPEFLKSFKALNRLLEKNPHNPTFFGGTARLEIRGILVSEHLNISRLRTTPKADQIWRGQSH